MGRYYITSVGGLGSDANKDSLTRAKLQLEAQAGDVSAAGLLAQMMALIPLQQAWDAAASAIRSAAEAGIRQLPASQQAAARAVVEQQVLSKLGPRPSPKQPSGGGSVPPPVKVPGGTPITLPPGTTLTTTGGGGPSAATIGAFALLAALAVVVVRKIR